MGDQKFEEFLHFHADFLSKKAHFHPKMPHFHRRVGLYHQNLTQKIPPVCQHLHFPPENATSLCGHDGYRLVHAHYHVEKTLRSHLHAPAHPFPPSLGCVRVSGVW